ncbi:MAG: 2,3-bisphosphoglycerate-dependent phosphoglycerate mutase [Rhabdochlamydiaceae bacterium]|nr:2,3-bisphosphoglycerate-dependent phosphoglycerate mutase [Rhabdochlamydiaceae bacterium]
MVKLILLRHGQSEWNKANLFTGWVDIPLSQEGITEAIAAGKELANTQIDCIYASSLLRAQMTAFLVMAQHSSKKMPYIRRDPKESFSSWYEMGCKENAALIPMYVAWELNERMYGNLQAKNKKQTVDAYGEEQVQLWRRSYNIAPPDGESLEMTAKRSIPFFESKIIAELKNGLNVLVCAHGNSLRSIVMEIEHLTQDQVLKLEIPTGVPLVYEYCNGSFEKVGL